MPSHAVAARTAVLLVSLAAAAGCRSAPAWMRDGMTPPPLEGVTVDGERVSLAGHRGKVVAVVFFADWCPHCRGLYPTERELAERTAGGAFALIGVDADDTADAIRGAIARERITWPVVHDRDQSIAAAWGVDGLPTTYLLDADGVIRAFGLTGSSLVEKADAMIREAAAASAPDPAR